MAFDRASTQPVVVAGCVTLLMSLLAPVVTWFFGVWWIVPLAVPPVVAFWWTKRQS